MLLILGASQVGPIVQVCSAIACFHQWENPVLVGHDEQAVWTAEYTPRRLLWGTVGRKIDRVTVMPWNSGSDRFPRIGVSPRGLA